MLSRISRITQTGFNEDDDTKLNDVAKALDTVGIALTDQTGNFRDFGVIIDEIAVKWDTLDDKTQSYIANTIGGVRQQSRFFNLMNGYAESMDLYEQSLESAGTAQSKFNLYLESNQATLDNFRTTLEGLWITIIDSDSLMDIVRAGTSFIELLDSMVDSFGLLGSAATILIPLIGVRYVASVTSATKAMIAQELAGKVIGNSNISLMNGFKLLIGQLFGVKTAADGTAISFMGLNAAAGLLGVALVAIPMLITAITTAEDKRKKAMEESLALFEKQNEVNKSIGELVKSYEELGDKTELTAEENKKLLDVKTQIKDLLPQSKNAIDNENLSLKEQVEIIKDLNEQEFQRASMAASETIDKYGKDVDFYKKSIDERAKSIESMTDKLSELQLKQARGQELTSKESKELKNLIHKIELYNGHQENAINIVEAVESAHELLNRGLEENAERCKWARAEELESQAVRANSIRQLQGIEDELKSLGFTSDEVAQIMSGNLDEVKDKHNLLTEAQIENYKSIETLSDAEYEWAKNRLKNDAEVTRVAIENARARINAIKGEIEALTGRSTAKNAFLQSLYSPDMVNKESALKDMVGMGTTSALLASYRAEEIETINVEVQQHQEHLNSINQALDNLEKVKVTSGKVTSGSGISGAKDPKKGSSSSSSKKEEYKAEADAYAKINLELDKNNILLQKNKTFQDLAGDDLTKKIELMKEQVKLEKDHQDLLHGKANLYRKELVELEKTLSGEGFKFKGSGDNRVIDNLDNIKGKTKEVEEQFKRYIEIQSKEIPGLQQLWWNLEKSITDVGLSMEDSIRKAVKEMVELEKRNAYLKLELDEREAKAKLKELKDELDEFIYGKDGKSGKQGEIDSIQAEIDGLQESERVRSENMERAKRLEELSKLQNQYYHLQYTNLANMSEEQAKLLGLEKEREQHLENQAKIQEKLVQIQELQIKLDNIRREKNIQQLKKNEDGTWEFEYVADQKAIDDTNKQISDANKDITKLQEEHDKSIKNLKEKTLEDLRKAQENYNEWEYQNNIQRTIREKQERIKAIQDEIKDEQAKYTEKERLSNEHFTKEKEKLDIYYRDIDLLTDTRLIELQETFDTNWGKISKDLETRFDKIKTDYLAMLAVLGTPITTGAGGGGKISGNPTVDAAKYAIDQNIKDWWEADARGDSAAKKKASEQADAIRKSAGLDDYAKTKDEVDKIKKKYGFLAGGETRKTGLHWFDGEVGEPERILSAQQTKDFNKLVENMPDVLKFFDSNKLEDVLKSAVLSTFKVAIPKIPKLVPSGASGVVSQSITIEEMVFPNVRDAKEIESSVKSLSTYANQWANQK